MPVRSLNSVVMKWPDRDEVLSAARRWATALTAHDPAVQSIFCVGSCARGDWGVGSDLDVIVVLSDTDVSPFGRRLRYEPQDVPVPADVWVYTKAEWGALGDHSPQLWCRLQRELVELGPAPSPG